MYLLYVDESGDSGIRGSPTRYFVLTGLVVHELRWNQYLERIVAFRTRMRSKFGLLLREEIHSARLINRLGALSRIKRNDRLTIVRNFANEIGSLPDLSIINVVVDKDGKLPTYDVIDMAWRALIQRFSNTMSYHNFPGPANADETGVVVPDRGEVKKIATVLRRMRRYNPVPNQPAHGPGYRNLLITNLIEDPYFKDSEHSYFIQAADLAAFLLYQRIAPSSYFKMKSARNYFRRLDSVLCRVAATTDPDGIVRL